MAAKNRNLQSGLKPTNHKLRYEHDLLTLLTLLNSMSLFSETSATVIDSSEKHNRWLSLELERLHVIERRSKTW